MVPTDPAAQKALLMNSGSKYKVSNRPTANVKLTSLSSVHAIGSGPVNKVRCRLVLSQAGVSSIQLQTSETKLGETSDRIKQDRYFTCLWCSS